MCFPLWRCNIRVKRVDESVSDENNTKAKRGEMKSAGLQVRRKRHGVESGAIIRREQQLLNEQRMAIVAERSAAEGKGFGNIEK